MQLLYNWNGLALGANVTGNVMISRAGFDGGYYGIGAGTALRLLGFTTMRARDLVLMLWDNYGAVILFVDWREFGSVSVELLHIQRVLSKWTLTAGLRMMVTMA